MKGYKNYKLNKKNRRYNKYENIEIKSFYDTEDVNNLIDEKVEELEEDNDLVVYAKRDLVSELFINMIENDYDFGYIDFDRIDDLLKDEVYIMTISYDRRVNIEHAYHNGRIAKHESKIALFYTDDCKQDIIDYCIDNDMEVILFDFEGDEGYCDEEGYEDCGDCDSCNNCNGRKTCDDRGSCENYEEDLNTYESKSNNITVSNITVSKAKNGIPNGFTKKICSDEDGTLFSTTFSFHSDDLELLENVAEEFGVKL